MLMEDMSFSFFLKIVRDLAVQMELGRSFHFRIWKKTYWKISGKKTYWRVILCLFAMRPGAVANFLTTDFRKCRHIGESKGRRMQSPWLFCRQIPMI